MDVALPIPEPRPDDHEDVHWALSTASALWARGEATEALKWLRRAAETASDENLDERALELAKAAADFTTRQASMRPPAATASAPPPEPAADAAVTVPRGVSAPPPPAPSRSAPPPPPRGRLSIPEAPRVPGATPAPPPAASHVANTAPSAPPAAPSGARPIPKTLASGHRLDNMPGAPAPAPAPAPAGRPGAAPLAARKVVQAPARAPVAGAPGAGQGQRPGGASGPVSGATQPSAGSAQRAVPEPRPSEPKTVVRGPRPAGDSETVIGIGASIPLGGIAIDPALRRELDPSGATDAGKGAKSVARAAEVLRPGAAARSGRPRTPTARGEKRADAAERPRSKPPSMKPDSIKPESKANTRRFDDDETMEREEREDTSIGMRFASLGNAPLDLDEQTNVLTGDEVEIEVDARASDAPPPAEAPSRPPTGSRPPGSRRHRAVTVPQAAPLPADLRGAEMRDEATRAEEEAEDPGTDPGGPSSLSQAWFEGALPSYRVALVADAASRGGVQLLLLAPNEPAPAGLPTALIVPSDGPAAAAIAEILRAASSPTKGRKKTSLR